MTSARFLAGLLQPLLALLLLAGAPARQEVRAGHEPIVKFLEAHGKVLGLTRERASGQIRQAPGDPDRLDGDDGPDRLPVASEPYGFDLDLARFIVIGRAYDPTAPPTYWPCAAPSTGPPLA